MTPLMTAALNHEDEDYVCEYAANPTECPFKGFKLIEKVRMNIEFSEEDKANLRGLIDYLNPSNELIDEILENEDISTEYDKFCLYNNISKHFSTGDFF
jgi:hypothetical protein